MRPRILVAVVGLAWLRLASQAVDDDQARLLTLENMWNRSVQTKDTKALELLLAPELVYVDYDGKLMNKTEYLASVQSPTELPARVVSESMRVHVFGAAAVVDGVYRENGMKKGKPYMVRARFIDMWVRRSERWVCVASDGTVIGP